MKGSAKNCRIRGLAAAFMLVILLFCAFTLCACNRQGAPAKEEKIAYKLGVIGYGYDEETLTVTAYVALSGGQQLEIPPQSAVRVREAKSLFYNSTRIEVSLNSREICAAVRAQTPEEIRTKDNLIYNSLSVALRYDTIYKSVKTNGERFTRAGGYTHILALSEDGDDVFVLSQTTQNSANWYSLLMALAIALFALATGGYLLWAHAREKHKA